MKNFKKIFAIVFAAVTLVFAVLVTISERESFEYLKLLGDTDEFNRGLGILALIVLISDILLILFSAAGLVLVLFDKLVPFKAIVSCAVVVLVKFLISIFAYMLLMAVWKAPAEVWKDYFFGKDSLAIIPLIIFVVAVAVLLIATANQFEGTLIRAVLTTIGAGLAIFGLCFYFIPSMGDKPDWLVVFGLVVALALQAGAIVYSYLPQTREFKAEE